MKQSISLMFLLLITVLACKASQPTVTVLPASPTVTKPTSTLTSIPTQAAMSTLRPIPMPITCKDDSCLNACLERIDKALPQNSYEPLSGAYAGDNIDLNLVSYDVKDGQLSNQQFLHAPDEFKQFQQDTTAHKNVWAYASGFLPPEELKWIVGFEIFSSSYYAAWVRPGGSDQRDRSHWTLGMDIVDAQDPVNLTYILAHEYGHLISLNTDQIPASDYYYNWTQNSAICTQFLSPYGCSKPNSYVNLFYQKFWKGIYEEWQKVVDLPHVNSSDEFRALVEKFYKLHPDQFGREYDATNIHEDIANSFMYFVLNPKPSSNNIVNNKIRFFYDFPELVSLRQFMIQNICSYTQ